MKTAIALLNGYRRLSLYILKIRETSNQYHKPYRPLPIALYNYLGRMAK